KRVGVAVTTRPIRYHKEKVLDENGDPVLLPDGSIKKITIPQEKGIDVRLALDLVSLARKKQYDVALIFSQDQDLQEVVQEIWDISKEQDRWIKIACAFPGGPNASSSRGIDKTLWLPMERTFYDLHLDPRDYRPKTA